MVFRKYRNLPKLPGFRGPFGIVVQKGEFSFFVGDHRNSQRAVLPVSHKGDAVLRAGEKFLHQNSLGKLFEKKRCLGFKLLGSADQGTLSNPQASVLVLGLKEERIVQGWDGSFLPLFQRISPRNPQPRSGEPPLGLVLIQTEFQRAGAVPREGNSGTFQKRADRNFRGGIEAESLEEVENAAWTELFQLFEQPPSPVLKIPGIDIQRNTPVASLRQSQENALAAPQYVSARLPEGWLPSP